jgi:hypothetical protein
MSSFPSKPAPYLESAHTFTQFLLDFRFVRTNCEASILISATSAKRTKEEIVFVAASLLFVPGSRADRFAKARTAGAGLTVIDLEDAVASAGKCARRCARPGEWCAARLGDPDQWGAHCARDLRSCFTD